MATFREEIEFKPANHKIIPLSDLLDRDAQAHEYAVQDLRTEFKRKGWCITEIRSKDWIKAPPSEVTLLFENFFFDPDRQSYLGYSEVPHKRNIFCRFGDEPSNLKPIPKQLRAVISEFETRFNEISDILLSNICGPIYKFNDPADVLAAAEIGGRSLYASWYWNRETRANTLIDGYNTTQVNCVPHFDPCLFSISFHSTHEGLQMYDPIDNVWFAAPNCQMDASASFYAVIWAGYASTSVTNGKITPGLHRVVYPRFIKPRLTLWLEVSTKQQVKCLEVKEEELRTQIRENGFFATGFRNFKSTIDAHNPLSIFRSTEELYGTATNMPLYSETKSDGTNPLYHGG